MLNIGDKVQLKRGLQLGHMYGDTVLTDEHLELQDVELTVEWLDTTAFSQRQVFVEGYGDLFFDPDMLDRVKPEASRCF